MVGALSRAMNRALFTSFFNPLNSISLLLLVSNAGLSPGLAGDAITSVPPSGEDRYSFCMDMAENAPDKGINLALVWQTEGGGVPARHCEAVGLYYAGEYGESALRLQHIAEDMRLGRDMPLNGGKRVVAREALLAGMYDQIARSWLLAGEIVRSESAIDTALSLVAKNSQAERNYLVTRARIAAADGDHILAIEDLSRVKKGDPGRVDILLLLGSALRQAGRLVESEAALTAYQATHKNDPALYLELGNLYDKKGDKIAARRAWVMVLQLEEAGINADAARANIERLDVVVEKPREQAKIP